MAKKSRGRYYWRNTTLYTDIHVLVEGKLIRERKPFARATKGTVQERKQLELVAQQFIDDANVVHEKQSMFFDKKYKRMNIPTYDQMCNFYLDKYVLQMEYNHTDDDCMRREVRLVEQTREKFGSFPANEIEIFDLKQFQKELKQRKTPKGTQWKNSTVNRTIQKVGQIYTFAMSQVDYSFENFSTEEKIRYGNIDNCIRLTKPTIGLPKLTEEADHKEIYVPTKEQFSILLERWPKVIRNMALTAIHTGLRPRNVVRMKWEQVNLFDKTLLVDSYKGKGQQKKKVDLLITMHPELFVLFKTMSVEAEQSQEFVFVQSNGEPYTDYGKGWRIAFKDTDIPYFPFRGCRTAWASWQVAAGAPMGLVQRAMGHSTLQTTSKYYNKPVTASEQLIANQPSLLKTGT